MSRLIKAIFLFLIVFLSFSCGRKIVLLHPEKVERRKTSELVDALDSLILQKPQFFYTKISTKFKDTTQSLSFKTSIRMVRDSAMSANITFASIPIINSLLTPDSLVIVDKKNKCYQIGKLAFIKESFGVDFSYKNVEELVLGLPLAYDTTQKYFQIHDPFNYIISSHRKREIKRTERKDLDDIIIKYFLTSDAKNLKRMEIESPSDSTRVYVDYLTRQTSANFSAPLDVLIQIFTPRNRIEVELNYDKIEIEERPDVFIVIPESYEICE